jgi:cytochrome b561
MHVMTAWRNSGLQYGRVAQAFHWVLAVLVFVQAGIGVYVDDLPLGIERIAWMSRHKALGITILALVVLRIAWRMFDRPPAMPSSLSALQRRVALTTHWLLYVMLIASGLAGWLAASAAGIGISWFGLFTVPMLIDKQPDRYEMLAGIHEGMVIALLVLILFHSAAAIWHAVQQDGVMSRMLPGFLNKGMRKKS